jgi:amidase
VTDELWRMSAVDAVARLRNGELSPLNLVEASARRIAEVEPAVNALPTLCLERARDHARRIMQDGAAAEAAGEAGWLAGLPVSIKDLTDVAGVRTTYGSPLFADHVPTTVGRAYRPQGRHRDGKVEHAGIRCGRQYL